MKKILSLMALLMLSITATWADTVDELVAVDPGYTFIADNITENGKTKLTANTLYDSDRIFAPTANSVATNKGSSTFAGGSHLNSLRLKNTQDQLVFKVSKPCVVTFYTQKVGDRGIQAGSSAGGTQYGTQTGNTATFECTIPAAGLVYLSSFGGDFFFAGFEVTTKPIFFDNSNAKWENVYIWAWNGDVNYTGGNWPGVKMTATGTENLYTWSVKGDPTQVIFSNGDGTQTADLTFEGGATYNENGKVVILNDYTVNLSTDAGWANAYAYTWTGGTEELGAWPGKAMTSTGAGTWTITVQAENAPANIIFHNGAGDQTKDLAFVADKTYEYNQQTYTATFTTDAGWETVNAYVWSVDNTDPENPKVINEYLGAWPGTPITATAGVYTATINTYGDAPEHIQFNNGSDGKTPDLVFTEGRAYKWNTKVTPLYALAASEVKIPAGTTVNVTDAEDDVVATLTYGVEGGADFAAPASYPNDDYAGFTAYTAGNGENGSATAGTVYIINPVYDGKILVGVWLNANKNFYITEDGNALEGFNGITIPYKANTAYEFDVKAGSEYKVYCTGSKLGFFGFDYTFDKPVTVTSVELRGSSNEWGSALATFTETAGTWSVNDVDLAANDEFKVLVNYSNSTSKWLAPQSDGNFLVNDEQLDKALALKEGTPNMYVNHNATLSFSMNSDFTELTITGTISTDDVYTVSGSEVLTGFDWGLHSENNMDLKETDLYEWSKEDVLISGSSEPEFQIVKNSDWATKQPSENPWKITLDYVGGIAGWYDITITFKPSTNAITVTSTKTAEEVVIGASGWATTVTNSPLDFSATAVEAYTATLSGTTVTLNKVENVPAETGLVLKGAEDTYYVPVIASSDTPTGSLSGSSTASKTVDDSSKKCFGLAIKNEKAQFVKIKNAEVIPAKKAFLEVEPSTPANEFTVVFEDESGEATGIQTLNAERNTLNGETYNLAGQKVNKSYKGLVISNGKKVVMK